MPVKTWSFLIIGNLLASHIKAMELIPLETEGFHLLKIINPSPFSFNKLMEFLDQLKNYQLFKEDPAQLT